MTTQTNDWATKLIEKMREKLFLEDDADICCSKFAECYASGDSVAASQAYEDAAEWSYWIENGGYSIHIFYDGSAYCSINEGIDMFFPDWEMLAEQSSPEIAELIRTAMDQS